MKLIHVTVKFGWICIKPLNFITLILFFQFYAVMDMTEDLIFMHVDNPGGKC